MPSRLFSMKPNLISSPFSQLGCLLLAAGAWGGYNAARCGPHETTLDSSTPASSTDLYVDDHIRGGTMVRPQLGMTTAWDSRLSQYDKERLKQTERRVQATVQASMHASASLPDLVLSPQRSIEMAYDDPIRSPSVARQRMLVGELRAATAEVGQQERAVTAWESRRDKARSTPANPRSTRTNPRPAPNAASLTRDKTLAQAHSPTQPHSLVTIPSPRHTRGWRRSGCVSVSCRTTSSTRSCGCRAARSSRSSWWRWATR